MPPHQLSATTFPILARRLAAGLFALLAVLASTPGSTFAQEPPPEDVPTAAEADADEPTKRVVVRFLTEGDYPPFNFYDEDGTLVGFNVDLARAICMELNTACDIKVRPWGELLLALRRGEADAVIAAHAVTPQSLNEVDFTDRYFQTPGRFAARRGGDQIEITPEALESKRIGVAKNTAHEAFLRAFFRSSAIQSYENADLARDALIQGQVDYIFDDGIGLVFWGVAEPISHYANPPPGVIAASPDAAGVAMRYAFFHWGLHPWEIYGIVGLSIVFFSFRRKALPLVSSARTR